MNSLSFKNSLKLKKFQKMSNQIQIRAVGHDDFKPSQLMFPMLVSALYCGLNAFEGYNKQYIALIHILEKISNLLLRIHAVFK